MVVVGGPDAFEALSRAPPSRADAAEGFRAEGEAGPREPFFFFSDEDGAEASASFVALGVAAANAPPLAVAAS